MTPLRERGTDFSASYVAALAASRGEGAQLYDQQTEHARASDPASRRDGDQPAIHHAADDARSWHFRSPLLDPGTAFRVWSVIELILLALAVWIAIRAGPWPSSARSPRAATAAHGAGGRWNVRVPPPRPDRRGHGARPGGRVRGLAKGPIRQPPDSGWRSRSPPPSRTSRSGSASGSSPAGTGGRSPAQSPGCALVAAVSLVLVGPGGLGGFVSALGFAARQHPGCEHARHPGPGRLVAREAGPSRLSPASPDRSLALAGCWRPRSAVARRPARARGLARRGRGAVTRGVTAPAAARPRDPRPGIRLVRRTRGRSRGRALARPRDHPADRRVGRPRRAHPRRHRQRGACSAREARAPGDCSASASLPW